ncbi:hypothetical protein [Methylocystis iwaonis]|uniref:hypothetical protein n=1 Tax=Methylocystis iwaonis TaxID=2885079 RepID=UPI002E7BB013|nr:hypothetical protein [Methylocystis iwaonis]
MREGLLIVGPYPTDLEPDLEYAGFDGEFWPGVPPNDPLLEEGLAPLERIESVKMAAQILNDIQKNTRLIAVCNNKLCLQDFSFCGFDVGVLENAYNHFSFILNDILNIRGLFRFEASSLNDNRLFQIKADAIKFAKARSMTNEKGMEAVEPTQIEIFPIWRWKRS